MSDTHLFQEAEQAADAGRLQIRTNTKLMERLGERLRRHRPYAVVTCARGSSDHAATFAKYLIETRLGILTSSAAPSVSSVYSARTDMKDVLVLAISQSGRSPDLLAALKAARQAGAFIVALVNAVASPLEELA